MRWTSVLPLLLFAAAPVQAQGATVSSTALVGANMCYDQARQRLVFALTSRDIWECDGAFWGKPGVQLPAVTSKVLYDESRQRVFFVCSNRLLAYDGHGLVDHGPVPFATTFHLTADHHRGRLVGIDSFGLSIRTFEWDGVSWQQVALSGSNTIAFSIAYDAARMVTVAQALTLGPIAFHTMEWDGATWAVRYTSSLNHSPFAFDPVRRQVIGTGSSTWAWDGSTWTQLPTTANPYATSTGADRTHGRLWAFNGSPAYRQTIWAWNGLDWAPALSAPHPELNWGGFTFDPLRGRAVLYGAGSATLHREWDGSSWHDFATGGGPPSRSSHSQTFDPVRGETVVFGGRGVSAPVGDTWAWNGASWRLAATTGPSPRSDAATTFDTVRGRLVLVGGYSASSALTDHWEWDGANWTLVAATTPMGPASGALGYDEARARLVYADQDRTWEHDGIAWTMVATPTPMPQNFPHALVWDPARQRLQGNLFDANYVAQQYEWDGVQWTLRSGYRGSLAYDSRRSRMLAYQQTQLLTMTATPAGATDFGSPCGGSTTVTSFAAFGVPRPGDAAFHFDVRAEAVQRPVVIGFGLGQASVPLGNGCTFLLQQPFGSVAWFTDANGFLHLPFPLPNALGLRGVSFTAQAAVLDPASPGGIALSQGLALAIGD